MSICKSRRVSLIQHHTVTVTPRRASQVGSGLQGLPHDRQLTTGRFLEAFKGPSLLKIIDTPSTPEICSLRTYQGLPCACSIMSIPQASSYAARRSFEENHRNILSTLNNPTSSWRMQIAPRQSALLLGGMKRSR